MKKNQQKQVVERRELKITVRNPSQFGNALLRFRRITDLTQQSLGERAGIKQSLVSVTEQGNEGTTLKTLFKLLAALDLEIVLRRRRKDDPWK